MPNRILKESICYSDTIDKLSWLEEVLFYRLIVRCDDYGRYDGRLKIIKGTCFPLKDITESQIDKALNKLSSVGIVELYNVDEHPYLQIVTWENHQQIRNHKSKYPAPDSNCKQLKSIDINCARNPIQSESNPNPNPNPILCADEQDIAKSVIDHLNNATGLKYRYTESNLKGIIARLHDGFTAQDCIAVIDTKCSEWLTDPAMAKYLRPETLFRPSKFESYLNESKLSERGDGLPF